MYVWGRRCQRGGERRQRVPFPRTSSHARLHSPPSVLLGSRGTSAAASGRGLDGGTGANASAVGFAKNVFALRPVLSPVKTPEQTVPPHKAWLQLYHYSDRGVPCEYYFNPFLDELVWDPPSGKRIPSLLTLQKAVRYFAKLAETAVRTAAGSEPAFSEAAAAPPRSPVSGAAQSAPVASTTAGERRMESSRRVVFEVDGGGLTKEGSDHAPAVERIVLSDGLVLADELMLQRESLAHLLLPEDEDPTELNEFDLDYAHYGGEFDYDRDYYGGGSGTGTAAPPEPTIVESRTAPVVGGDEIVGTQALQQQQSKSSPQSRTPRTREDYLRRGIGERGTTSAPLTTSTYGGGGAPPAPTNDAPPPPGGLLVTEGVHNSSGQHVVASPAGQSRAEEGLHWAELRQPAQQPLGRPRWRPPPLPTSLSSPKPKNPSNSYTPNITTPKNDNRFEAELSFSLFRIAYQGIIGVWVLAFLWSIVVLFEFDSADSPRSSIANFPRAGWIDEKGAVGGMDHHRRALRASASVGEEDEGRRASEQVGEERSWGVDKLAFALCDLAEGRRCGVGTARKYAGFLRNSVDMGDGKVSEEEVQRFLEEQSSSVISGVSGADSGGPRSGLNSGSDSFQRNIMRALAEIIGKHSRSGHVV